MAARASNWGLAAGHCGKPASALTKISLDRQAPVCHPKSPRIKENAMPQRPMSLKIGVAIFILSNAATLLQAFYLASAEFDLSDPVYWITVAVFTLVIGLIAGLPAYAMLNGRIWGRAVYLGLALLVPLTYETGLVTATDIANATPGEKFSIFAHAVADFVALLLLHACAVNIWFDQAAERRQCKLPQPENLPTEAVSQLTPQA